jgi:copper resistance protein C
MSRRTRKHYRHAAGPVAAIILASFAMPLIVLAHAELESASPADGAVLDSPPTEVVLTFTEALDPVKSHMELIGPDGTQVAAGVVDPDNERSMRIDPPELAPGAYEIRSTAFAAHDGALKRETLTFTINAPSPTPSPTPTAAPSASATPAPSPSASPSASPSPAPSAGGPTSGSGADVFVPILAALVVVVLLGAMLMRGRSRGGGPG